MAGLRYASHWLLSLGICLACQASLARDKLPVWELENTDNRVLIMGSVHFLRSDDYPLPDGLNLAYEQADRLVMEVDMDDLDPMEAQSSMTRLGISQDGRSLKDIIGADSYAHVADRAKSLGLPIELFQQFEPWFAALTISQMQMLALGFDPNWGIETQLMQKALKDGKSISGLETLDEQLGFLDRLDEDTQKLFLLQSLEEATQVQEELESMVNAWRTGNTESMAELFLEDMLAEAPGLYDALLVQRNQSWLDEIESLTTREEDYLIVVGALHLVGEDSVIRLLGQRGFPARQLSGNDLN